MNIYEGRSVKGEVISAPRALALCHECVVHLFSRHDLAAEINDLAENDLHRRGLFNSAFHDYSSRSTACAETQYVSSVISIAHVSTHEYQFALLDWEQKQSLALRDDSGSQAKMIHKKRRRHTGSYVALMIKGLARYLDNNGEAGNQADIQVKSMVALAPGPVESDPHIARLKLPSYVHGFSFVYTE